MKEYIEKVLHQDVQILPYEDQNKLPLAYTSRYGLNRMNICGREVLVAEPKEKIPLVTLRKQHNQLETYTGLPCVLYLINTNYYARDTMLNEGIPFVWEGHQIYLPFIGTLLDDHRSRTITNCARISYLTQKMLLTALYHGWKKITVTKAASMLGVSKMSASRCFDELEAMSIPYLTVRNRARSITADTDKREMWNSIKGILRNPVITTYALKKKPDITLPLSGMMALAHYSMLNEDYCPILAITKKDLSDIRITGDKIVPAGEAPGCIIQELGYRIPYEGEIAVDPLTVALSISEEEQSDPRVSLAIDEMLEEHVW